jgi:hypothetical protein
MSIVDTALSSAVKYLSLEVTRSGRFKGWYCGASGAGYETWKDSNPNPPILTGNCRTPERIIDDAFQKAKQTLLQDLKAEKVELIGLCKASRIDDVKNVLDECKAKYDAKPTSKARKWLGNFSSKILFYNPVLDVLAQYSPEYTSLVWGSMKFVLMVYTQV